MTPPTPKSFSLTTNSSNTASCLRSCSSLARAHAPRSAATPSLFSAQFSPWPRRFFPRGRRGSTRPPAPRLACFRFRPAFALRAVSAGRWCLRLNASTSIPFSFHVSLSETLQTTRLDFGGNRRLVLTVLRQCCSDLAFSTLGKGSKSRFES